MPKAEVTPPPALIVDDPVKEFLAHAAPDIAERKVNLEYITAIDSALQRSNGFGFSAYIPARDVIGLPPGASRYFVQQKCKYSGKDRRRALQRTIH